MISLTIKWPVTNTEYLRIFELCNMFSKTVCVDFNETKNKNKKMRKLFFSSVPSSFKISVIKFFI